MSQSEDAKSPAGLEAQLANATAVAPPPAYAAARPMIVEPQPPATTQFQTSLLGCAASPRTTAAACLCPCVTYGANRDRILHQAIHGAPHPTQGQSCSSTCTVYALLFAMPHFGAITAAALRFVQRVQFRTVYGIAGHPVTDCLAATFCGACAEIQIRRELDLREQEGALRLQDEGEDAVLVVAAVEGAVKDEVAPPQYTA